MVLYHCKVKNPKSNNGKLGTVCARQPVMRAWENSEAEGGSKRQGMWWVRGRRVTVCGVLMSLSGRTTWDEDSPVDPNEEGEAVLQRSGARLGGRASFVCSNNSRPAGLPQGERRKASNITLERVVTARSCKAEDLNWIPNRRETLREFWVQEGHYLSSATTVICTLWKKRDQKGNRKTGWRRQQKCWWQKVTAWARRGGGRRGWRLCGPGIAKDIMEIQYKGLYLRTLKYYQNVKYGGGT